MYYRNYKRIVGSFIVVFLLFFILHAQYLYRSYYPQDAFKNLLGFDVPQGIKVIAYDWEYTDNLFHVSQYFLFEGDELELSSFATLLKVEISTKDASYIFPQHSKMFGVYLSDFSVKLGFEGNQTRNNWYWLLREKPFAIYEYNGNT